MARLLDPPIKFRKIRFFIRSLKNPKWPTGSEKQFTPQVFGRPNADRLERCTLLTIYHADIFKKLRPPLSFQKSQIKIGIFLFFRMFILSQHRTSQKRLQILPVSKNHCKFYYFLLIMSELRLVQWSCSAQSIGRHSLYRSGGKISQKIYVVYGKSLRKSC